MTTTISTANLPPHAHTIDHDHGAATTSGFSTNHYHAETGNTGDLGWLKRGGWNGTNWDASFVNNGSRSVTFHAAPNTDWGTHDHTHTFDVPFFGGSSGNGPGTSTAMTTAPRALPVNWMVKVH
jgi:hypothetical protein